MASGGGRSSGQHPIDRRSLHEKRQSYIRHRAANRSPFFGAGGPSSRTSSQSRRCNTTLMGCSSTTTGTTTTATRTDSSHRTTYSASSSLEPPLRITKRRDQTRQQQLLLNGRSAEAFQRPVSTSLLRRATRGSLRLSTARSSRVFESAEEEESSSFYSQSSSSASSSAASLSVCEDERAETAVGDGQPGPADTRHPTAADEPMDVALARGGRVSQARRSGAGRGSLAYGGAVGGAGSIMDRPRPRSDLRWRRESGGGYGFGVGGGGMGGARVASRGRTPLSLIANGNAGGGRGSRAPSGSGWDKGGRSGSEAWGSFRGNEAFL